MNLKRGINLGGFLSQCVHTKEHYDSFIKEEDIEQISAYGFDHVRLPIDYEVFETEDGEKKRRRFCKGA
jgi:aryl-phospho-beta-D-glucosidase BglC (GH1 family)